MQYGIDVTAMRAELEAITKTSMDIPDSHIELLWMLWQGAIDKDRPNWSRRECELFFEYLADGNCDVMLRAEEARAMINRGSQADWDYMGLPPDELDASA